jgi:hypothetical protein
MRGLNTLLALSIIVFLVSIGLILFGGATITGHASSGTAFSNVTVSKAFDITLSANLSAGIEFGSVSTGDNHNATDNYDPIINNDTYYIINISTNATVDVDICLKGDGDLTDDASLDFIGISNESFSNDTTTNLTLPEPTKEVAFNLSGQKAGENVVAGTGRFYRFFLDITDDISSGTYNNTITFTGVENGDGC